MSKFLLQICFLISSSATAVELEYYQDKARIYTHETDLNINLIDKSKWNVPTVKEHLEEAAHIYAQCGIKLNIRSTETIESAQEEIYFDLEGYDSLNDFRPILPRQFLSSE